VEWGEEIVDSSLVIRSSDSEVDVIHVVLSGDGPVLILQGPSGMGQVGCVILHSHLTLEKVTWPIC
jgi:hypothetical protein